MASSTDLQSSSPQIMKFEDDLTKKIGTELLDTWDNYITYMEHHRPRKLRERIAVMRRCVLSYRKTTEFNETVKFVNIWLKLAATMDEPKIIYERMKERIIGSSLAIFYRDWAEYCAHNGFQAEVSKILELGVQCNAGPSDILVKCKEDLLTHTTGECRKPSSVMMTKTKINRSHLYYDPDVHSPPGTIVKYHKASIYAEAFELSFEELKAKLTKYSSKKKTDTVISSVTNQSETKDFLPKKSNGNHVGDVAKACQQDVEIFTEQRDDLSEGIIDVEEAETCHNTSHSFLEDYVSDVPQKRNANSIQDYETILLDLDVTRKHDVHTRDIKDVRCRHSTICSTEGIFSEETDTSSSSNIGKQSIKPKSQSSIFRSKKEIPSEVSIGIPPSSDIKEVSSKKPFNQVFGSPVVNPDSNIHENQQHKFKQQEQQTLSRPVGEVSPCASPDESFEKMFEKSPLRSSAMQAKGFKIFQDKCVPSILKESNQQVKGLDIFHDSQKVAKERSLPQFEVSDDTEQSSGLGNSFASHDMTTESDLFEKKSCVTDEFKYKKSDTTLSGTPGRHTMRTQNILSNMFSETIAWEPGEESSEMSKSDISFDKKFEKVQGFEIFQDGKSKSGQGDKKEYVKKDFKGFKDSSVIDSSRKDESRSAIQPEGFKIFKDSSENSTRDKKENFNVCQDKPVLPPKQDKTITPCDITADSDVVEKKSPVADKLKDKRFDITDIGTPVMPTVCTQNILNMFSETMTCDFQDQSSEITQNDTLFDTKLKKLPVKDFEIFQDTSVCSSQEENKYVHQPKGFEIFQDEPVKQIKSSDIVHDLDKVEKQHGLQKFDDNDKAGRIHGLSKAVTSGVGDLLKMTSPPVEGNNRKLDLDITSTPGIPKYESTAYFGVVRKNKNDCNTRRSSGIKNKENIFGEKIQDLKQLADFSDLDESPNRDADGNTDLNLLKAEVNQVRRKREGNDLFGTSSKQEQEVFKCDLGDSNSCNKGSTTKDTPVNKHKQILVELSSLDEVNAANTGTDFLMPRKTQKPIAVDYEQLSKNFSGNSIFDVSNKKTAKSEIASLLDSPLLQNEKFEYSQMDNKDKFEQMFEKDSKTVAFSIFQDRSTCDSEDSIIKRKKDTEPVLPNMLDPGAKEKYLLDPGAKEKYLFDDCTLNNDSVQPTINSNTDRRKRRSLSGTDEDVRAKRFISTPYSPGRNHCITFNQQVSQIIPNINFEKTQNSHLYGDAGLHLSPIAERSNEDSKGSSDQSKASGECSNEANEGVKASNVNFIQIDNNQMIDFVQKIYPIVETYQNFKEISGPLPKLQGATMNLNIGLRNIRVRKCIEKQESYALYSALFQGREEVTIKCLEKTRDVFYQCMWDVYVGNEIHKRIDSFSKDDFLLYQDKSLLDNFMGHNMVCIFDNSMYIESMSFSSGTVMDTINLYKNHQCMMDESLAMLYTYEILNIIYTLHKINIIHGDLNPNVFFQKNTSCMTNSKPLASRLITLNKFSSSIDLTLIADHEKIMFRGSNLPPSYPCPEMRKGKAWKYNVDYYAGAATIHLIAFQCEMEQTVSLKDTFKHIRTIIPRDWDISLWTEIFSTLLIISSVNISNLLMSLISKIGARLVDPKTVEKLKQAHLKTYDLDMDDDDDDDDDDTDDED